ncbi:MAG: NFACT family protein [Defluviitaleaceae bacterium]|nr:NFACT family protein [Defluviitaleaceae bacterium]
MAFDGIAVAALVAEVSGKVVGGRIDKINMPEKDEIVMTVRSQGGNLRLLLSCNASFPRLHLTAAAKENPITAPLFCMMLRKHLQGGRIIAITQPTLERIVRIDIDAYNEMGDLVRKTLVLEIMGRHSNIILIDGDMVLDCIKHISLGTSVRPMLPGRQYLPVPSQDKKSPFELDKASFTYPLDYIGISKFSSGIFEQMMGKLYDNFAGVMQDVAEGKFFPYILFNNANNPQEFAFFGREVFGEEFTRVFASSSDMVEFYYGAKDTQDRVRQRSADMRRVVSNLIERCVKKADVHQKTLRDIADKDRLRLFGELINANIYAIPSGARSVRLQNFYDENWAEIDVPLDVQKSAVENAQMYFKKYNKQKRTVDALVVQMAQNEEELAYLEAVMQSIEQAENVADLVQIREELQQEGFIKKAKTKGKQKAPLATKPLHFTSSDGFDIFVGKNNQQNDQLTKAADGADIWLHTKNYPGSHVIIRNKNGEVSQQALEEAANLAAYYSKARNSSMVAVDYCPRKNVKKPAKAKPGMVIYDNYKTAYITPKEPSQTNGGN